MKEIVFLKKYQEKWKELETLLSKKGRRDPDKLSELFIQLTDDLSFARTYYPDSNVTVYLNSLSSQLHQEIYRNKKENSGRFVDFWVRELPLTIRRHHHMLLIAFVVFAAAFTIGWVSSARDDGFVRLILGDGYVSMTEENISNGKPMDVYGKMGEGSMFLAITANNIYVSFVAFVLGIFFGLGSVYLLISNGIMVGAFLQMFYQKQLLADAMLAIWMHGTIEISVIIVAGAAGMVLGKSILFPKTFSRGVSVRKGAIDGLKIVIGLVPCFILAGFIESFLTRHYNANPVISASVIVFSLAFLVTYFIVYPIVVSHRTDKSRGGTVQKEIRQIGTSDDFIYGGIWLAGGLLVTAASYIYGQDRFILFYGAIIYGAFRLVKGFVNSRKISTSNT